MPVKKKDANDTTRILIVEDSPTQAEQLKYLLEQNNYTVTSANNGKQAIDQISGDRPSLVITDIVMPGMSGYELCKKIKSDEETKDIPVILLTSLANSEDVLEGLACGADNFISKPYNESYLLANIENIIINIKLRKNERVRVGLEIRFGGKNRFITADQQQMLSMLISTYEAAVNRNNELIQAQEELTTINERLEELVEERTTELLTEIAQRKLAAERLSLARDTLYILNRSDSETDTIRELLTLIKENTGFEAVAIRIVKDDDFPYYESIGFPDDFIKMENSLCKHDSGENILRDPLGKPVLRCMCGDILSGRFDPRLPFFTEYGSFWTNKTTEFPATTDEKKHPSQVRDRCREEGYESIALIPIRSDNTVIGLLQLNDHRAGRFSLDMIRFFESLSASIGIALKRKWIYEELQNRLNELQRWYNATLDREDRVQELKKEVNDLLAETGKPARYSV